MSKIILHIAEKITGGGAESVFRDTVNSLKEFDFENRHLVACIAGENDNVNVDYKFKPHSTNNTVKLLSSIFSFNNYVTLKRILKDCKPEIIHIQSYANLSPSVLLAIYWYKKQGNLKKVIHTVHTFEYVCSNHAAFDYKKKKICTDCKKSSYKFKVFYRSCSRAGYFHSIGKGITSLLATFFVKRNVINHWITPSDFLKSYMLNSAYFKNRKADISVIKNPLSQVFNDSSNPDFIKKQNAVIYFGRLSEEKNIELLINGFAVYKKHKKTNTKLFIAGDGNMYDKLKGLVDELKIASDVEFTGFLQQQELKLYLLKCKLSVLPSKCFETASMLVLESLFANCIPLVANQGGMQEMVNWTKFGKTFESNNAEKLAENISYLIEKYEIEIANVDAIKNTILPQISLKNYASQLMKLYN